MEGILKISKKWCFEIFDQAKASTFKMSTDSLFRLKKSYNQSELISNWIVVSFYLHHPLFTSTNSEGLTSILDFVGIRLCWSLILLWISLFKFETIDNCFVKDGCFNSTCFVKKFGFWNIFSQYLQEILLLWISLFKFENIEDCFVKDDRCFSSICFVKKFEFWNIFSQYLQEIICLVFSIVTFDMLAVQKWTDSKKQLYGHNEISLLCIWLKS